MSKGWDYWFLWQRACVCVWSRQKQNICGNVSSRLRLNYYLNYCAGGEVHLNDEHDGDPDDRADYHEPSQNHGPGGVGVILVCHYVPLVQTQSQDALHKPGEYTTCMLNKICYLLILLQCLWPKSIQTKLFQWHYFNPYKAVFLTEKYPHFLI